MKTPCPEGLTRAIPARARDAATGSAFARSIADLRGPEREALVRRELLSGNIPAFLRRLKPVPVRRELPDGRLLEVVLCVAPDYLAVGSDTDYLRIPMSLYTAVSVSRAFDAVLPTTRIVDAIHRNARHHIPPIPLPPGPAMRSTDYYRIHDRAVEQRRRRVGARLGDLVDGAKKDLVLSERLLHRPGRVAIYGWYRSDGSPIQPLSTLHGARYVDYSHGVRLVSRTAFVRGRPVRVEEILADAERAALLSDEGPLGRVLAVLPDRSPSTQQRPGHLAARR